MLNHNLLFSVPCCLIGDGLIKETACNVMVDHLQSRVTPWRQCTSHVKVRGTSSQIDENGMPENIAVLGNLQIFTAC